MPRLLHGGPIVCAGHPRDMGIAQGHALREIVRDAVARAGLTTGRSRWPSLRAVVSGPLRGRGAGRELFRHFAHQAERLEGLAQAANLPLDSLLELQLRLGAVRAGRAGDRGGVADVGDAGWIVRESRPVVGFRSLELTLPWLVPAVAGVNEAGLAVIGRLPGAGSDSATRTGARRDGDAPALLLVQDCLARFEHLAGALDWCRKRPVEGDETLLLGDASGARATVVIRGREHRIDSEAVGFALAANRAGELSGRIGLETAAGGAAEAGIVRIDPGARLLRLEGFGDGGLDGSRAYGFAPLPPSAAHTE